MKLYFSPGACSLAPHIVLMEAGFAFDLEKVDIPNKKTASGADYWQINPKGYVPALQLDNGEVLTEVSTILQYLADQKPASGLVPAAGTMARYRLMEALNARMRPARVAVTACEVVADDWHARFSCIGRAYIYRIANRRAPLTLERNHAWQVPQPLDADAMHRAAQALVGSHDFTTFRSVHCQAQSPLKTLDRLEVERVGEEVHIRAAARSFLHHQVRSMVGCLALVGMGRWREQQMAEALAARDRAALGLNAPSEGLYFVRALYPGD